MTFTTLNIEASWFKPTDYYLDSYRGDIRSIDDIQLDIDFGLTDGIEKTLGTAYLIFDDYEDFEADYDYGRDYDDTTIDSILAAPSEIEIEDELIDKVVKYAEIRKLKFKLDEFEPANKTIFDEFHNKPITKENLIVFLEEAFQDSDLTYDIVNVGFYIPVSESNVEYDSPKEFFEKNGIDPNSTKKIDLSSAGLKTLEGLPEKLDYLDISNNPDIKEFAKNSPREVKELHANQLQIKNFQYLPICDNAKKVLSEIKFKGFDVNNPDDIKKINYTLVNNHLACFDRAKTTLVKLFLEQLKAVSEGKYGDELTEFRVSLYEETGDLEIIPDDLKEILFI